MHFQSTLSRNSRMNAWEMDFWDLVPFYLFVYWEFYRWIVIYNSFNWKRKIVLWGIWYQMIPIQHLLITVSKMQYSMIEIWINFHYSYQFLDWLKLILLFKNHPTIASDEREDGFLFYLYFLEMDNRYKIIKYLYKCLNNCKNNIKFDIQ